jgi:CubicO group peptidase (beta-lactamase class C family)
MTASTHPDRAELVGGDATPLLSLLDDIAARHPSVGLAAAVIRLGAAPEFATHGYADLESRRPMTKHTGMRIASISKTFTAIAVMQLVEDGLVHLDDPVDDHLTSYRLQKADPRFGPVTIRHLLTHTGGLGELSDPSGMFKPDFGESFPVGTAPTLADFYHGSLDVVADPGTRWVYNNHGPATLGQLVEDVRRKPLRRCLREGVFEPLGMLDTDLERSVNVETRLAAGYEIGQRGVRRVAPRDMVTAGAAGIFSTPADMARYLGALVSGGRNDHGSILSRGALESMFAPHHQPHPLIPGTGLGFWRSDLGGHLVVGHQGTIPGFHGQILVAPRDRVAVMLFTNGGTKPDFWIPLEARRLLAQALGVVLDARPVLTQHPEIWGDIAGFYRLDAALTDVRLRGMLGVGAEVLVRNGEPLLRFLTPMPALFRGFPLIPDDPDDPYVYRLDLNDDGLEMRVVFDQDMGKMTDRLHLDLMPITLTKQPPVRNPRRLSLAALGGLASAGIGVGVVARLRR